ncbi:MAG: hypothetical protein ACW976_06245, partial [Candidatus Ranarchaeia archaeon]|jgi:phosphoribosylaminoimidazolecarboxamide formyltransferase/IMP cyclohydrolase
MPGGLIKTLHPKIHGGLLAEVNTASTQGEMDKSMINPDQAKYLEQQVIPLFDLVVCNLYPFIEAVKGQGSIEDCRSQIDIGGPTLIRSAAKNFPRVAVLTHPDQYGSFLKQVKSQDWHSTFDQRFHLAKQAFETTSTYDHEILNYLNSVTQEQQHFFHKEK